jgi:hypothetical protein
LREGKIVVQVLLADGGDAGGAAVGIVLMVLGFVAYWIPTIVAFVRGVPNKGSVLVINLFLGWTFIGWIVALAMSVRSKWERNAPPQYQQPGY